MTNLKTIASLLALSLATALVSGCGTVYGAGKDVSAAGKVISKTASENKNY